MTDQSVNKIRDIIFGEQMHAYDERLASIEALILSTHDELTQSIESRQRDIETLLNEKITELESKLAEERSERLLALSELLEKLTSIEHSLSDAITSVDQKSTETDEQIRAKLRNQVGSLQLQLQKQGLELRQSIDKETSLLHGEKISYSSLAGIFRQFISELEPEAEKGSSKG